MKPLYSLSVIVLAMTASSASLAQSAPNSAAPAPQATSMPSDNASALPAESAGVNASSGPIPADQLPPAQAAALAAGDNRIVTNGPVPDTPANRAKYGGPNSRTGRKTAPAGN